MTESTLYIKRKRPLEAFVLGLTYGAAVVTVLLLAGIFGYVLRNGVPALSLEFFTTVTSELKGRVGIAGNLVNTVYIVLLTLLIATPVGVGAAIYLNEYAKPGRLVRLIEFTTEILSGIPSVVFGLFGMVFFGTTLGLDYSILNGCLTLSLMVLPLIVRNTQEALRMVPGSYRSGALGMGAPRWYMIRTVLLPSALPGILSGVILAAGRIVGESAALLFTAGSARLLPGMGGDFLKNIQRLWEKPRKPGGSLAVELYLQMQNGRYEAAFAIGCVLIAVVLAVNVILKFLTAKMTKQNRV